MDRTGQIAVIFVSQRTDSDPAGYAGAADRLKRIPGVIVHGRYDVVTPAKIAVDLARVWPEADLRIVADAGHAMTEAGIVHELVTATNRFAR